jgi:hypothetical protein
MKKIASVFALAFALSSTMAAVTVVAHTDRAMADSAGTVIVYPEQASQCDGTNCWGSKPVSAHAFSPPWFVQELDTCFVVTDSARQKLAYIYYEDDPERRSATRLLSRDEALHIAGQVCEAAGFSGHDCLGF